MDIFPNPVLNNEVNLRWKTNEAVNIEIYDIAGKIVKSFNKVQNPNFANDVSDLNTGVYTVRLKDSKNNKLIAVSKFVKK